MIIYIPVVGVRLLALFGKSTSTSLVSFQLDLSNPPKTAFSWELHLTRTATFSWLTALPDRLHIYPKQPDSAQRRNFRFCSGSQQHGLR